MPDPGIKPGPARADHGAGGGQQPVAQVALEVARHEGLLLLGVPLCHRHVLGVAPEGRQLSQRSGIEHLARPTALQLAASPS